MASKHPDEGLSASDDGDSAAELLFRTGGTERTTPAEARPELRDRETYYAELRFAVHCQSRSIPGESWDDMIARFDDTWT